MSDQTVVVLHRKSANEEYVKEAVKTVHREGHDFRVLVPFNKKEKPSACVSIESDQKLHCNLDGEPIRKKRLRFSVLPSRLRVAY